MSLHRIRPTRRGVRPAAAAARQRLAHQADEASEAMRVVRDLRFPRGSAESYQLTGQSGELAVAAELMRLPNEHQERRVRRLIADSYDYLRFLRRGCDA